MSPGKPSNQSRRELVAALLTKPVIKGAMRRVPGWRGVLVLNYHRIGDHAAQPWDRTLWSASGEALDAQLEVLAREAEVIGPDEVESAMLGGQRGRRVLLTFDDGYRDNYEVAYPLLRRHGLTATFFLATGFIDRPRVAWWDELAWMVRRARADALRADEWLPEELALSEAASQKTIATLVARYKSLPNDRAQTFLDHVATGTGSGRCNGDEAETLWMTWEMAREMRDGGMSIGGHTVTHPVLSQLPRQAQEQEIAQCASRLARKLAEPMRWFAYPVGGPGTFTQDTQRILSEHGVQLAFSFYGGFAGFSRWNPMNVPRVHVGRDSGPERLRAMVWLPQIFTR
ncbi:MAG: polysaccharide deacetylase family protein [Solirubrobacteraceae bacterium]